MVYCFCFARALEGRLVFRFVLHFLRAGGVLDVSCCTKCSIVYVEVWKR